MAQPIGIFTMCLYALDKLGKSLIPWIWNALSSLQGGIMSQAILIAALWIMFFLLEKIGEKLIKWFSALLKHFEK